MHTGTGEIDWRHGELEWEAWMRQLDNAGLRTGHVYRCAHVDESVRSHDSRRCATMRPLTAREQLGSSGNVMSTSRHSDVETPPTVSGIGTKTHASSAQ